jgi:7-carboxy-7-deazaguanine synthase
MSVADVLATVESYGCQLVEVTGGEPLAQSQAFQLIGSLCEAGFTVLIETSGALDISPVDRRAHVILDVKCPGSGMMERMWWPNLTELTDKDEVKFVIAGRSDYDWAVGVIAQYGLTGLCPVLMSPVFETLEPRQLAEWILADRLPVRFQLQLHKFIWAPDARGV